ncbi:MAG: methylated-DNA--[protein]-cysteine S-methyltransferase, partial [Alphaproteobacteria bacterium]|nr:methylated-DNA--[protein]-cysteine S-methyltransferase [Alphaproteobacteria bacterium]
MKTSDSDQANIYYKALLERDSNYVGIFYVGVKTTSVFCIATCRARKPKFENVVFYSTFKEALDAGFRPCKVCKPTENAHEPPEPVVQAMALVRDNPKEKVSDTHLRKLNISPEMVRRWFKKHYDMTFQAYQRMYRINVAYEELKLGKKATDAAFDSGYESLSGFGYTFKKVVGASPIKSPENSVILIDRLTTPLGPMFICATDKGVCLLEFVDRKMLETEFQDLQKRLSAKIISGENEHIKQAKKEIHEYFEGSRKTFEVSLHTPGTDFQQSVWQCLRSIPYGKTYTYQEQAEKISNPKAVRAVASANGYNRISIIIPCHRVIGKDGKLSGYGGGLERKRWLID